MGAHGASRRGDSRRRARAGAADLNEHSTSGRRGEGGFALLEIIVSIFIIGLLLSLVLPALAGARANSRRLKSRANLKQLQLVTMLYAGDFRDLCPATYEGEWYPAGNGARYSFPYWQVFVTWPGPVYDYLPVDEHWRMYVSPGSTRQDRPVMFAEPSYHYSTSFVGPTTLWGGRSASREASAAQVPQRVGAVVFPSTKAMMWDEEPGFDRRPLQRVNGALAEPTPMAMADGSVGDRAPAEASDPVPNPIGNPVANRRLHNTRNGVAGIDYASTR